MIRRNLIAAVFFCLVGAAAFAGCQQRVAHVENPMRVTLADTEVIRFHVADVLEEMFFVVERPPRQEHRVDTRPLTSAHWFECWRPDTRTATDVLESSLHTIRRQVVVYMTPAEAAATDGDLPPGAEIEVVVTRQRLSLSGNVDAGSMGELYSVYTHRSEMMMDSLDAELSQGAVWEDLGRDPALEEYILAKLRQRL